MCRFGGLRCPSEVLALTWADVNWEHNRIRVPSPKTEHIDGKASRLIPLFPELREHLLEVFDQAETGTDHIIIGYRDSSVNLRTQLTRIIHRAGLEPWPKLFQNLRSTRETELAEAFPMHVVCRWIGNSEPVAAKHYLQMTDEHFERAVAGHGSKDINKAAQNAAQKLHERRRTGRKKKNAKATEGFDASKDTPDFLATSCRCETYGIPPRGVEPLFTD
ncbi:MAG: tyrosine-type recombinase/integrase [Planctomycetes bacterium]|nr:tyrosine-type recombinase/integrase [Planctomycetota bacterium]